MDSKPEFWVSVNVHADCTLNCPTMSVERKEFPLRNELAGGCINSTLNMTFQTYCSTSANKDYNADRATVFVFLAARAPGSFQSCPDKPVWETCRLLKPHAYPKNSIWQFSLQVWGLVKVVGCVEALLVIAVDSCWQSDRRRSIFPLIWNYVLMELVSQRGSCCSCNVATRCCFAAGNVHSITSLLHVITADWKAHARGFRQNPYCVMLES